MPANTMPGANNDTCTISTSTKMADSVKHKMKHVIGAIGPNKSGQAGHTAKELPREDPPPAKDPAFDADIPALQKACLRQESVTQMERLGSLTC